MALQALSQEQVEGAASPPATNHQQQARSADALFILLERARAAARPARAERRRRYALCPISPFRLDWQNEGSNYGTMDDDGEDGQVTGGAWLKPPFNALKTTTPDAHDEFLALWMPAAAVGVA